MSNEIAPIFKDSTELRQEVISTCLYMHNQLGYFIGTWGNISVRLEEGLLVTPSRINYAQTQPEDLVVVGWEGGVIRGHRVPTSETELHRQLMLERRDFGAIIHSHSPWASVCACANRAIPVISDDMAEIIGGEVKCAKYAPAGHHAELARNTRAAIGPDACAVLLGNHGMAVAGRDLNEAGVASQIIEKTAMAYVQAEALGGAKPIPEKLWREERNRYLYKYGRPEDVADILGPKISSNPQQD